MIVVWVLTVFTLVAGGVVGYLIGARKLDEKIEKIERRLKATKVPESGPVQPYTKQEINDMDDAQTKRIKELL